MKEHEPYSVEDFLLDESFVRWTRSQSPPDAAYWEQWLREHPNWVDTVREAQRLLLVIEEKPFLEIKDEHVRQDVRQIMSRIRSTSRQTRSLPVFWEERWWQVAAAVLLLVGFGWFFIRQWSHPTAGSMPAQVVTGKQVFQRANTTTWAVEFMLPDSSSVLLSPNSRLTYADSAAGFRVVNLTGEALFRVVRNPKRPFLVYTSDVVTKVLGTSFLVKAFSHDTDVRVSVRTGKVSVFSRETFEKRLVQQQDGQGVILTPNKEVRYDRTGKTFQKLLVEQPLKVDKSIPEADFELTGTPIPEVFRRLEKAYGVAIVYDEDLLKDCAITASLSDEGLYDKLRLLCRGINATYEVVDAQIIINSKGCN